MKSSIRYKVSGIRYQVSGIRYKVSGIQYQVSGISHEIASHELVFMNGPSWHLPLAANAALLLLLLIW